MSKVMTFSRVFPAYHPKAGEPTYFVEKILNSIGSPNDWSHFADYLANIKEDLNFDINDPKHHTIRAGHRWKVGDKFSPRVWSGKPYKSKQIIIAPDIEVKKVWDFEVYNRHMGKSDLSFTHTNIPLVAANDGLELVDFMHWFNKPFTGQIICWNDSIEY